MRARGLRRSEASICSIAMSGWPASILSTPLANHPRVVRVERQGTINQRHHGTDILAEISQRVGGPNEIPLVEELQSDPPRAQVCNG